MLEQAIFVNDVCKPGQGPEIRISDKTPIPRCDCVHPGELTLSPGLFRDRRDLAKAWIHSLDLHNIFQNHLLEAGIRSEKAFSQMHQGWEQPWCQLRGHFAGHWLSAAARYAVLDNDGILKAKIEVALELLAECQNLNGGQWPASIPEKYFTFLEHDRPVWSPQYTVHKTLAGLLDVYKLTKNTKALVILENAARWFTAWADRLEREGKSSVIYRGECSGMLELWADLYGISNNPAHLRLAACYAGPDLFMRLKKEEDPLANIHANASIPWIHGAARLYELTGDEQWKQIVQAFWQQGVKDRGAFATTGANAGEYWIPKGQAGRFLGSRTQEHCTVYNMVRVAQYLLRWTGESHYADYIEKALFNGILAQQHPHTGAISYFLPLEPGSRKVWGSPTADFWCCHGTLVQAQSLYEDLIWYHESDGGMTLSQFIPSKTVSGPAGKQVRIELQSRPEDEAANFIRPQVSFVTLHLQISCDQSTPWTLRIRNPEWAQGAASIKINGTEEHVQVSSRGFLEITRDWREAQVVVSFRKSVTREYLPGDPNRFALVDGPLVLACTCSTEPEINTDAILTPQYEHQYLAGREWQSSHYLIPGSEGVLKARPIHEISDEAYTVYVRQR